jgi:hypothetical protein
MSRVIWLAVGAVGGIVLYRKGQSMIEEAREQGVITSAQRAGAAAAGTIAAATTIAGKVLHTNPNAQGAK